MESAAEISRHRHETVIRCVGRDIVEPTYGIYIRFDDFGDSSVNVAVRQYVLVPEQIEYKYKCKELIYKILAENNITIPFPQRDVHMINDNK